MQEEVEAVRVQVIKYMVKTWKKAVEASHVRKTS
jgi:hypothetical protein